MGKGQKFSGHGSMTKYGKVRFHTPKVERTGVNSRRKETPRKRFKQLYEKRILDQHYGGQPNSIGAKKWKINQKPKDLNMRIS